MTDPAPVRRWWRARRQSIVIAVVLMMTLGTLGLVASNAVELGRVTAQVQASQAQSTNLANATRECLLLLQLVSELGESSDQPKVAVQRGLLLRQVNVAIASFPADASEVQDLRRVQTSISALPLERLPRTQNPDDPLRLTVMATISQDERSLNALRSHEEKEFYSATIEALNANQRSQLSLAGLVAVVLALGAIGVTIVLRTSRSEQVRANEKLKLEVGERKAVEQKLRASEGRFRSLVQRTSDLTVVTDVAGVVSYVSPASESLLGYAPDELLGRPLLAHVEPEERSDVGRAMTLLTEKPGEERTIELHLRTRDGRVRLVEAVCQNLVQDPDIGGLVWNGRDVTDRRALEDELIHQALYDPLTGLPNRALLLNRLGEALLTERPADRSVSVILIDLDGFKNVNDTLGHPAGDALLRHAAQRLLGCVRDGDTAARIGGDEFAVLAATGRPYQAVAAGRRIVERLREPFTVAGQEVRVGASIGVAHRNGRETAEDLLRDADIAMYVAKNTGKGRLEVFVPEMRIKAAHRTSIQQQLAQAVERGEIEVHYQPIIDLKTFRPIMLEALSRWRRPDMSLMPADDFIPIAEESGAIVDIGREALRQACQALQYWRRTAPAYAELGVAVNVSIHQVLTGRLAEHVIEALRDSGITPSALTLEITESSALGDPERVAVELGRLRHLGVRIAVDDFGAGYSSLGFLMGLNVDVLKIDRSLLDFDTTQRGSLVTAIAELGRTLGLTVVVEGVETLDHLDRAYDAACDAAQGYHFSRPLPFAAVPRFFREWSAEPTIRTGD